MQVEVRKFDRTPPDKFREEQMIKQMWGHVSTRRIEDNEEDCRVQSPSTWFLNRSCYHLLCLHKEFCFWDLSSPFFGPKMSGLGTGHRAQQGT